MLGALGIYTIVWCPVLGMIGGLAGVYFLLRRQGDPDTSIHSYIIHETVSFSLYMLLAFCSCGIWAYQIGLSQVYR